jgi:AraC-like DNA-binding protein
LRPDSVVAIVSIRFYPPCQELRGVVARIYAHTSGRIAPGDPQWLIVPDGDVKLIFPHAGSIRCRVGTTARLHPASRLIVSGMRTQPGELSFPNGVDAIGVIIRPEAAYRLLGMPHHEIINTTFDGEEIFDALARRLQEELIELSREEDRVARLQTRLCEWLRARDGRDLTFENAVWRLKQREGRIRIEDLARHAGWSRRHLERRFLERAGIGPKELANVLRFHAVYKRMRRTARGPYASLIQDHYFDQSHFLKAFKQFTGVTPRVYSGIHDYGLLYIPD